MKIPLGNRSDFPYTYSFSYFFNCFRATSAIPIERFITEIFGHVRLSSEYCSFYSFKWVINFWEKPQANSNSPMKSTDYFKCYRKSSLSKNMRKTERGGGGGSLRSFLSFILCIYSFCCCCCWHLSYLL